MEVKIIKIKVFQIVLMIIILLISISSINAIDIENQNLTLNKTISVTNSQDLTEKIENSDNNDEISINPGTYKIHNIKINCNLTLQGNGNPRDIIIDGEEQSSIFLIKNPKIHVIFKNITFINGLTHNFGGAISIETGHVYVDNCIFINNTALNETNAGAISNYGTKQNRGYLFVNNSIFINNHADHDGGAITTCYADSDIYNCVFINNSAVRDGGAIRVSVFGYGNVQDCIFMFNHADEWGGAYYSWSGESNIKRCIFMNNTAGTNGGAVMVSGNINLQDSIIVNNDGGETGGSFYIQQPMYNTQTYINVNNNIITNNTSPYGKEIFIKWDDSYNLFTDFNDNDWGDENPNDSSINDPNNVTSRIKVSKTIKSDLFSRLNVDLLDKYNDLLTNYFTKESLDTLKNQFYKKNDEKNENKNETTEKAVPENIAKTYNTNKSNEKTIMDTNTNKDEINLITSTSDYHVIIGNSTSLGENKKIYELNESKGVSFVKQTNSHLATFLIIIALALILFGIGFLKEKKISK